jgi:ribose/xylose/arabinose/galactoside ABC-type transport system permease subunit
MLTILSGITLALVGSTPPTFVVDGLFNFSYAAFGPFSLLFLVGAASCVVLALGITFTRPGRHLRAAGGDANAATRAGIPVNRLRFAAFLVSSFGAAIAGIFYIGQNGGAAADTGLDFTFQVTAALMIGGFSVVRGGIGNPLGGLFGLLVIGGVGVLLDIKQIDSHFLDMVLGVTLIIAVLVDRLRGGDRFD